MTEKEAEMVIADLKISYEKLKIKLDELEALVDDLLKEKESVQ